MHSPFVPNDTIERMRLIDRAKQQPPIQAPRKATVRYLQDPRTGELFAIYRERIVRP